MDSLKLRGIVATNLIQLSREKGMSLSRIAELAGLSHATVIWASRGQSALTLDSLAALALALAVEPHELLVEQKGQKPVNLKPPRRR